MSEPLSTPERLKELTRRHLIACEAIYKAAIARNDIDTAAHVSRSAQSVALGCVMDLGQDSMREITVTWHERLKSLHADEPATEYLSGATKRANREMLAIYVEHKPKEIARIEENQ